MMMPSIFGENLFDDFMDDFSFPTFRMSTKNCMENMLRI